MNIRKSVRINPGYWLSFVVIIIPAFAWMVGFDFSQLNSQEVVLTIVKKTAAFLGMAMLAWSLILSARFKIFDDLFQGLDKMYGAHRFFGVTSIALLLLHPLAYTLLYIQFTDSINLFNHFLGFKDWPFTLGRISLYGIIIISLWSMFWRVKHETFIIIHRLLGVLFVFGALHAFTSNSTTVLSVNPFLYWYMLILSVVAALSYLHYSWLADFLHSHRKYRISYVRKLSGNIWDVRLKPKFQVLNFRAGQFAYLSFGSLSDNSYHPFTISSGIRNSELQFYIKELGDLTSQFNELKKGQLVKVKGPYGGFTFGDRRFTKQLWIGAGIGITPFLSKARGLHYDRNIERVELIYGTTSKTESFAAKELQELEENNDKFNYTLVPSSVFGKQSLSDILSHLSGFEDYSIYLCGPPSMMEVYLKQAEELGLSDRFFFEEFAV